MDSLFPGDHLQELHELFRRNICVSAGSMRLWERPNTIEPDKYRITYLLCIQISLEIHPIFDIIVWLIRCCLVIENRDLDLFVLSGVRL